MLHNSQVRNRGATSGFEFHGFRLLQLRVAILLPGDVPPVVPKPAADEAGRFRQYNDARVLRQGRRRELQDKPLIAELTKVLAAEYKKLGPQGTCDHLLAIMRRGAEASLASLDTPEAIECMFEVLKPQSGLLSSPAVGGPASRCKGEVLDRVMRMMDEGGKSADQAAAISSPKPPGSAPHSRSTGRKGCLNWSERRGLA